MTKPKTADQATWQRPPFAPENELALVHGANSPRRLAPRAEATVAQLLEDPASAYLREPAYAGILQEYGRVSAQCDFFWAYLEQHGAEAAMADNTATEEEESTSGSKTRRRSTSKPVEAAWTQYHRASTRKANLAAQLGLTPLAALGSVMTSPHRGSISR